MLMKIELLSEVILFFHPDFLLFITHKPLLLEMYEPYYIMSRIDLS